MLKYSLRKNQLTADENDFIARVTDTRSYSLDEIIDQIVNRGSAMTRADIQAVLQIYSEVASSIIADGAAINTPLINSSFSITGIFKNSDDTFDHSRHVIHVNLTPGTRLKEVARKIRVEKVEASHTEPTINEVTDVVSGKINSMLTKGGVMRISGKRLKFDATDPEQGIFLLNDALNAEHCSVIVENKPAHVVVMIPPTLADGTYSLEIRTTLDVNGKVTKHLKTSRFDVLLTIKESDSEAATALEKSKKKTV